MEQKAYGRTNGRAYEKVIRYVQDQIVEGNLGQGQKLPPERELAERLQVGRNSVREALRTLSLMGFISSTQGAGNFVSCNFEKSLTESMHMLFLLNQIDYLQVSELRQGIETQAVLLAAQRARPEHLEHLRRIVDELRSGTDEARNAALDSELHFTIASASGNRLILQVLQALSETLDQFITSMRGKILIQQKRRNDLQRSHEEIVSALLEHDGERAAKAMRAHFAVVDRTIQTETDGESDEDPQYPLFSPEKRKP